MCQPQWCFSNEQINLTKHMYWLEMKNELRSHKYGHFYTNSGHPQDFCIFIDVFSAICHEKSGLLMLVKCIRYNLVLKIILEALFSFSSLCSHGTPGILIPGKRLFHYLDEAQIQLCFLIATL